MMRERANCKAKRRAAAHERASWRCSWNESRRSQGGHPCKIFGTSGSPVGYRAGYSNISIKYRGENNRRVVMGLGRGALLWLIGVPLPVIILIALFWHH